MKINIADALQSEGEAFTARYAGPMAPVEYGCESYAFPNGVQLEAEYRFDGEGVTITGSFAAEMSAECARCLKPLIYPVSLKFAEYFSRQPEDGVYAFADEEIDLEQMLGDNVVLSLPMRFLCREDCRGLCPVCGRDLNQGACGCRPGVDETNPFYGLSKLYDDEEV
jgi:Predicted metal-binding, possibly nucleic acid-binding protein